MSSGLVLRRFYFFFEGPGGKVGFFRRLIELAASDGEIAAVMAMRLVTSPRDTRLSG